MNTLLLIFFAIPIAVIIISIALQKIFKNTFLVAGIIFAIFLVVTFAIGNLIFLVATIAYTILAFITAVITGIICRIIQELDDRNCCRENCNCRRENSRCRRNRCGCSNSNVNGNNSGTQLLTINGDCSCNNDDGNLLTISSSGCNGIQNELLTINSNCSRNNNNDNNDNDNNSCTCRCSTSNNSIAVRANVFPNSGTNGRSGSFCGCFRRR